MKGLLGEIRADPVFIKKRGVTQVMDEPPIAPHGRYRGFWSILMFSVKLFWPLTVMLPVRPRPSLLPAALKFPSPLPVPECPLVMVSQSGLLERAVHVHPGCVKTENPPLPPWLEKSLNRATTLYVQPPPRGASAAPLSPLGHVTQSHPTIAMEAKTASTTKSLEIRTFMELLLLRADQKS
jgi:hypothetical protein